MGFYHSIVEKKNTKKKEGSARVRVRFGLPFYLIICSYQKGKMAVQKQEEEE